MTATTKRRVIENYTLNELLGQGCYGKVYKALHKLNSGEFAIKVIPVQLFKENKKLEECTVNEINILSSIKPSPHIVKYIQMLKTSNNFYFVYEFCNGGTLESLLKKEKHLEETRALEIFQQLVEAFKILYDHNIMHRDVKPDNILFHDGIVKLGDFGFCKNLGNDTDMTSTMLGSPIYMAPEVLKGQNYTSKADVWSLGVVLFEIIFGYCPFESNSIANLISTIKDSNLKMPLDVNSISENTQYLIRRMLVKDSTERISWPQIFKLFIKNENQTLKTEMELDEQKVEKKIEKKPSQQKQIQKKDTIQPTELYSNKQQIKPTQKQDQYAKEAKISDTISSSLNWQNDTGFKNFLATVNNPKTTLSKIPVDASLPSDLGCITNKIGNYDNFFTPSKVLQSVNQSVDYRQSFATPSRRKQIIQQHQLCTRGIKTAIDIINIEDKVTLTYSYLILTKVESRLRKINDSILTTDSDLQDISTALNIQLLSLAQSINELKQQLIEQDVDVKNLADPKTYLNIKFRQGEPQTTVRIWYQMIYMLFGDSRIGTSSTRDKGKQQMVDYIKGKLI